MFDASRTIAATLSPMPPTGDEAYNFAVKKEVSEPMLTDAPPRNSNLAGFQESDRLTSLDLPDDASLATIAKAIESVMKAEQIAAVRNACANFLKSASECYRVPECSVRVLASRPQPRTQIASGNVFLGCSNYPRSDTRKLKLKSRTPASSFPNKRRPRQSV
jgi:hypothetical protein